MEGRKHTYNMRIYSKIFTSNKGRMSASNRSLEEGPSVVTKAFPRVFLIILGHFYEFYDRRGLQ